jgi:ankyrin repeat protein
LKVGADPNIADLSGKTPLMLQENPKIVRLLLDAGADLKHVDNDGSNAFMFTINDDKIELLLKAGLSPNLTNNQGKSILNCNDWPITREIIEDLRN